MRKSLTVLFLIIALVLAFGAVGCGDEGSASNLSPLGSTGDSQGGETAAAPAPSEVLAMVTANTEPVASETGTFEVSMLFDVDTSTLPAEEAAFFSDPWTVSGDLAFETATQAADMTLAVTLMQQTMNVGIKTLGQQAWISLADQWYEAPPEVTEGLGGTSDEGLAPTMAQAQQLITDVSLDPIAWFKDQAPVGVETIDGSTVYHLSGSNPDWAKVVTDLMAITQNPGFAALMGEAGSMGETVESEMPTAEELQQMQTMLQAMIQDLTIDLWVQEDISRLIKATITARIAPPSSEDMAALESSGLSGMDFEGLNSVEISGTLTLNPNQAVSVTAPASALPYTEMESAIMANPALLGPFGSILSGAMGGYDSY
jgi:hypothetical protein